MGFPSCGAAGPQPLAPEPRDLQRSFAPRIADVLGHGLGILAPWRPTQWGWRPWRPWCRYHGRPQWATPWAPPVGPRKKGAGFEPPNIWVRSYKNDGFWRVVNDVNDGCSICCLVNELVQWVSEMFFDGSQWEVVYDFVSLVNDAPGIDVGRLMFGCFDLILLSLLLRLNCYNTVANLFNTEWNCSHIIQIIDTCPLDMSCWKFVFPTADHESLLIIVGMSTVHCWFPHGFPLFFYVPIIEHHQWAPLSSAIGHSNRRRVRGLLLLYQDLNGFYCS